MKKSWSIFLQAIVVLIALAVLVGLVVLPSKEGRAANLSTTEIYFDPFILYGYAAAVFFFVGCYKVCRALGLAGHDRLYSNEMLHTLKAVMNCALVFAGMIVLAALYITVFHATDDDPAGFLAMCALTSLLAVTVTVTVGWLRKSIKRAMDY